MAKQNKPAIRFKGFTDAWEQRELGEIVERITRKNENLESILPLTISAQYGLIDQNEFFDKRIASKDVSGYFLVKNGEFAYNKSTSSDAPWGAIKRLDRYESGVLSTLYIVFKILDERKTSSDYIVTYYNTDLWHKGIQAIAAEGARNHGLLNVAPADFFETNLTMPKDYAEQQQIGSFFQQLDHLITLHQRKYDKLQVLKKAMLEKMFPKNGSSVPEIRFKGFTDAWEQRKFSDITFPAGEKNKENLPLESYSITNESGFVPQDEKFENGGTMREADKRMYYIVSPNSFAYNPARINVGSIGYQDTGKSVIVSSLYEVFKTSDDVDDRLLWHWFKSPDFQKLIMQLQEGGVRLYFYYDKLCMGQVSLPSLEEQRKIGKLFDTIDHLITLHQRKPYSHIQRRCNMLNEAQSTDKFCEYYAKWITVYKKGAIRQVTMDKYLMTQKWLEKLIPDLKICDLNRIAYQQLLNDYAEYHERQTTMDFHHQLKGAVLDAVDEGLIDRDPTRKAIIKGKTPSAKKIKYLNQFELHTLLASLELKDEVNWDYFILLVAKTGMRFSEALALTPKDFDFYHQTLSISKTWDYKGAGGFQPTKNKSSVRKIQIDWQSVIRFSELVKGLPDDHPIFVDGKVYNSTVNDVLSRHCERCNIPVISIHGLRHTHASLLLFTGVSIASVARRLGHSSMTTTQKTYLHIIQELENKDIDLVMRSLSGLN